MVIRGFGEGIDLIWIHGLGEQSASFDAVAHHPALAGYTHLLVDLPGYGRAPWPDRLPPGDSLAQSADLLAGWIDMRPSDDQNLPVLIGHSQGGVLATMVAERTALRGYVNIEGNLTLGDCTFSAKGAAYSEADFIAGGFAAMRDDVYRDGQIQRALRSYHAALTMASPHVFHRNAVDLVAAAKRGDLARRLASSPCPTLYIAGVPNGICETSRQQLRDLGAHFVELEPSGHWPFIDQADRFAIEVAEFVRSLG
jgi:pimeloyl-ACP methyl ester carboxylesterase